MLLNKPLSEKDSTKTMNLYSQFSNQIYTESGAMFNSAAEFVAQAYNTAGKVICIVYFE